MKKLTIYYKTEIQGGFEVEEHENITRAKAEKIKLGFYNRYRNNDLVALQIEEEE